ncbi:hypothetical protein F2Q69_00049136 [Brassica cretica]|uniref:Uncharacterized protein n=1 Tax=Brassica cretica TaxID=69181 RepID=A0A8S9PIZ4_BRACR|nr:hypothetical protein F2Q69_00049136 [Brassica cretica]
MASSDLRRPPKRLRTPMLSEAAVEAHRTGERIEQGHRTADSKLQGHMPVEAHTDGQYELGYQAHFVGRMQCRK